MHIRAITPIHLDATELARRRARYRRLAPSGITVTLQNLPDHSGIPRRLEHADDIAASDAAVATALRALDPAEVDAALPDCVLDPGIPSRSAVAVPVHGITELAAGVCAALGSAFTAVARNRAIADELDAVIGRYGYQRFDATRVLELDFDAIADHAVWSNAVAGLTAELASTPVRRVLNGCSAVDVHDDGSGVAVLDPTHLALDMLGMARRHGLTCLMGSVTHG